MSIKFNLGPKVLVPTEQQKELGCIALQLVTYELVYFGSKVEGSFDTKILQDGTRLVIGGDGFFEDGSVLNEQL